MRSQDRFRGCLIGGASGDALGYPVEFLKERIIFLKYGEPGITEYKLRNGKALISDDTQMTLFTAEGLLAGKTQKATEKSWSDCINEAYLDWLKTQEQKYPLKDEDHYSWLMNIPELYSPRLPGTACMAALRAGGGGTPQQPINNSKGCGGIMRVAPIGLYFNDRGMSVEEICKIGAEAAALTHGHPLGWMPAAVLVQIIHEVSQDDAPLSKAVLHAQEMISRQYPEGRERDYLSRLIRKAMDLASDDANDMKAIHQLGEGWVAEETLAIAIYCALKYEHDFDRALIASVNHNGDSDSTGAVTGNILGAKLGYAQIPGKYTERLELKETILRVADELWKDGE